MNNYGASGFNAVMTLTQPATPVKREYAPQIHTHAFSIPVFSHTSLKSHCSALLESIIKPDASDSQRSTSTAFNAAFETFDNFRAEFDILARKTGCDTFRSENYRV